MIKSILFAAATAAALTVPTASFADEIDDAIKARRAYYSVVSFNMGLLAGMAKGSVEYNAEAASGAANDLQMLTQLNNMAMWPMGSSNEDRPGDTRAKPEAWTTFPAIIEKQTALRTAATAMAENAGEGLDALRANMGALGAACTDCHKAFRAREF